jgi:hypothetical protein
MILDSSCACWKLKCIFSTIKQHAVLFEILIAALNVRLTLVYYRMFITCAIYYFLCLSIQIGLFYDFKMIKHFVSNDVRRAIVTMITGIFVTCYNQPHQLLYHIDRPFKNRFYLHLRETDLVKSLFLILMTRERTENFSGGCKSCRHRND